MIIQRIKGIVPKLKSRAKRAIRKTKYGLNYAAAFPGDTVNKGVEELIKNPIATSTNIAGKTVLPAAGVAIGGAPGMAVAAAPLGGTGIIAESTLKKRFPKYKAATDYLAKKYEGSKASRVVRNGVDAAVNYARMFSEDSWLSQAALKQKLYTRGEKEALKQLYKKTNGFRDITKLWNGNPRDVVRFNKFASDFRNVYNTGNKKAFDRENAKELLKSLGLDKGAKEVDHVLDKYTNKRAWARWNKTAKPEKIKDKDILRDVKKTAGVLTDLEDKRVNFNGFEIPAKLKREDKELQEKAFEHINKDKKVRRTVLGAENFPVNDPALNSHVNKLKNSKRTDILLDNYSAADINHEHGHVIDMRQSGNNNYEQNAKRLLGHPKLNKNHKAVADVQKRSGMLANIGSYISRENSAANRSLSRLKADGASKEYMDIANKREKLGLGTYTDFAKLQAKQTRRVFLHQRRARNIMSKYD